MAVEHLCMEVLHNYTGVYVAMACKAMYFLICRFILLSRVYLPQLCVCVISSSKIPGIFLKPHAHYVYSSEGMAISGLKPCMTLVKL